MKTVKSNCGKCFKKKCMAPAMAKVSPEFKQALPGILENIITLMQYIGNSKWCTMSHGDPRIVNFFFKRKQQKEANRNSVDLKDLRRSGEEADALAKDKRTSRRRQSQGSNDSLEDNEAVNDVIAKVLKASLDDKLKQLREDLTRDLRRTNTEPLERIESIVLMMASKLDNVLNRQIQGDTWM